ncbi:hypothetical protein ACGFYE_15635 [Streptomyces zaomyceticus]|uniref:hypothetical protein n=1 Tax=Streptomyces zaomyceticus TaxID=68286 RepID=UPI00371BEF12
MTVRLDARRQAAAGDVPRSYRGPITVFAQAIPATLFGMPPVASSTVTRTAKSGRGL